MRQVLLFCIPRLSICRAVSVSTGVLQDDDQELAAITQGSVSPGATSQRTAAIEESPDQQSNSG
jgi:hypothetical protein